MPARYSYRQTRILFRVATICDWRDRSWGSGAKEPNWDEIFADPTERAARQDDVKSKIEEQKRLIAEARARMGGSIGRRSS